MSSNEQGNFSGTRILVVEDYEINQEVIKDILELIGCEVDLAEDGNEALTKFQENNYDLVFMDIQMPVMDGYESTKAMRDFEDVDQHTPIIALTANALSGDREKCLSAGMDDYMPKPIETNTIIDMLKRYLKKNASVNQ